MDIKSEITELFGNRVRVRVCGICLINNELLLIKHRFVGQPGYLWAPPGGGVSFGESLEACLAREFKEETGFEIEVKEFLFVYDFIEPPLHAIEIFFRVEIISGELILGRDPEMNHSQIIEEVKFCSKDFIKGIPEKGLHGALVKAGTLEGLLSMNGYFRDSKPS